MEVSPSLRRTGAETRRDRYSSDNGLRVEKIGQRNDPKEEATTPAVPAASLSSHVSNL